jgi:hypothetical protein
VLGVWREMCPASRDFPRRSDFDLERLGDDLSASLVIVLGDASSSGRAAARFAFVGADLEGTVRVGSSCDALSPDTLLGAALQSLDVVLERRVPVSAGGELHGPNGRLRLYRSIVLPLSEDGVRIDALLGAVNGQT